MILVSIGANSSAHVLRIVAGMPSDPLAFFVSSSGAMLGNDDGDVPSVGMSSVYSVNTELDCWLRTSAFSWPVVATRPSVTRLLTPHVFCFVDFRYLQRPLLLFSSKSPFS